MNIENIDRLENLLESRKQLRRLKNIVEESCIKITFSFFMKCIFTNIGDWLLGKTEIRLSSLDYDSKKAIENAIIQATKQRIAEIDEEIEAL